MALWSVSMQFGPDERKSESSVEGVKARELFIDAL